MIRSRKTKSNEKNSKKGSKKGFDKTKTKLATQSFKASKKVTKTNTNKPNEKVVIHTDRGEETRLNKYLSETGICSRREGDKLIDEGRVFVNGVKADKGTKVTKKDSVYLDGEPIKKEEELVYIALNKPIGITCTTEENIKGNIVSFVNHHKRIFPIGRLDKPSEGLIFLTNDGDIVNKILRAGNNHEKEYVVTVDKPISNEFIKKMSGGIPILDTVTKKCTVRKEGKYVFRIVLTEGLNRQIRRMCEYLGYSVLKLKRVRIMNVTLSNLNVGEWRDLTKEELLDINKLIQKSTKTEEASN